MSADPDLLTEYSSDEDTKIEEKKTTKKGDDTYVAIHSAGFREFLLKPELLRAIQDCGFEHPSEARRSIFGRIT